MQNKRGSLMLFVVTGVVLLLLLVFLVYLLGLWNEDPAASTSWEQPVQEYLRLCTERSGEEAVDRVLQGGGYMFDTSTLPDGFGPAQLLLYDVILPVHNDPATGEYSLVAVFDTDPGKVKELPNSPCYEGSEEVGSQYECDKYEFFKQVTHFPFGGGAVGEYQYREIPRLSLYRKDPEFPYEPKCSTDYPCQFSVEEQIETYVSDDMQTCVEEAITLFAERGIDLAYADEAMADPGAQVIDALIKDDGTTYTLVPLKATFEGEEKLIDNVLYTNGKPLKQLYTLAHGGSTDYVLGATGIIEAESRDPDFVVDRDGQDLLENALFLDPELYSLSVSPFPEESAKVTLSYDDGDSTDAASLSFIMINRKPFINQVVGSTLSMEGGLYTEVPDKTPDAGSGVDCYDDTTWGGATDVYDVCHDTTMADVQQGDDWDDIVAEVYHNADYCFYFDARDPDDSAGGGDFRPEEDVVVEKFEVLDTHGANVQLKDWEYFPESRQICFSITIHEGYDLEEEELWEKSSEPVYPGPNKFLIYLDEFDVSIDFLILVSSSGGADTVTVTAGAKYKYGNNRRTGAVSASNPAPVYFDQAWPWLILPNVDRGPQDHMVYFYEPDDVEEKCRIDFTDLRDFDPELIDTRFFPDKNLTHFKEYYPQIYQAIVTVIQEERNRSFGFDQCCPSYTLMTKFRDRGICAPELCCIQAPFLGHEIRFFEKGSWNKTTPGFTGDISDVACELETVYNEIGGDFYPQYLDIFFAENAVMDFRENLDCAVEGGCAPDENNTVGRSVVQVMPLRFKPDVFDFWTGESYGGPFEDYFQSYAAMQQWDEESDPPGQTWEFSWDSGSWMIEDASGDLLELLDKYPDMFKEGWTWWDYREVIDECDDGWTSRSRTSGDCIPEDLLEAVLNQSTDYDLELLDPYICDDYSTSNDEGLWDPNTSIEYGDHVEDSTPLPSIEGFGDELGRCPNMYETMKLIMNNNAGVNETSTCTKELCCFRPDKQRDFHWYVDVDPNIFEQYGSWAPEYGIPGTALMLDQNGVTCKDCEFDSACAKPANADGYITMCQNDVDDEGCVSSLVSYLDLTDPYASGGPFRSLAPLTRVTNFQWFHRLAHGSGTITKRNGDTMMPGDGALQYTEGPQGDPCSVEKILHRCAYGEGVGFDATDLVGRGIDPHMVGVHEDEGGARYCPSRIEAYELMINGTCRIEDCCLEFAPYGWQTSVGAPGGKPLGSYSEPCPISPAMPNGTDDDVGTTDPQEPVDPGTDPVQNPSFYP